MCFRPASADADVKPVECSCGETIFPTDGILPKFCPYCEEPLVAPASPTAPAPSIPGAPKAPASPTAPTAPSI